MKTGLITQVVTRYLAEKYFVLPGAMHNEQYFMAKGASNERTIAESRIVFGIAADVLADLIENDAYFGWWVPSSVEQATNPNNAKIVPLPVGQTVSGNFSVTLSDKGVLTAEKVQQKPYLDSLRTPAGFKQTAQLFNVAGDLEKITSTLYAAPKRKSR